MGARSFVFSLDAETRAALYQRIRESGYGRYAAHRDWLAERGCHVSVQTVWALGKKLQEHDAPDFGMPGAPDPNGEATERIDGALRGIRRSQRRIEAALGIEEDEIVWPAARIASDD